MILIGEIRDRETMEYGIQFAETGHLVLATLHANSSNQALDRIINFFPEERREQLLMDMSLNIRALISQRLIPREAGSRPHRGDGNHAQFAADPGPDLPRRGRQDQGSHGALDPHRHEDLRPGAVRPVRAGHISYEDALRNADSKNELRLRVKLESKRESKPVEADGDLTIAEEEAEGKSF